MEQQTVVTVDEVKLRENIDHYRELSAQINQLKKEQEHIRDEIDKDIAIAGLTEGNKMVTDSSSMTLFKTEKVVSVMYDQLEAMLGDRVEEFITKKVNLKELRAVVKKHEISDDILNYILTEKKDLTFTIRALKTKSMEDL